MYWHFWKIYKMSLTCKTHDTLQTRYHLLSTVILSVLHVYYDEHQHKGHPYLPLWDALSSCSSWVQGAIDSTKLNLCIFDFIKQWYPIDYNIISVKQVKNVQTQFLVYLFTMHEIFLYGKTWAKVTILFWHKQRSLRHNTYKYRHIS